MLRCWAAPSPLPLPSVMPKRVRSDVELEANQQNQRARYLTSATRLARLEEEKYEAKERVKGVDCSPASPLNEMEMAKKISGRPRKTIPLSLPEPGAQPRLLCPTHGHAPLPSALFVPSLSLPPSDCGLS